MFILLLLAALKIHISQETYDILFQTKHYELTLRGEVEMKVLKNIFFVYKWIDLWHNIYVVYKHAISSLFLDQSVKPHISRPYWEC
jgi:hypothetical protein